MTPLKKRTILSVTVGVMSAVVLTWFVHTRGGVINALGLPPVLDSSTLETQNGYTLLAVQRSEDNVGNFHFTPPAEEGQVSPSEKRYASGEEHSVAGLWIRMPAESGIPPTLSVMGHASSGEDFPLTASYPSGGGRGDILFTSLPGCYAGSLDYADVSISDAQGRTARWRIDGLPPMQHVITSPVQATATQFSTAGMTLSLSATRRHGKRGEYVRCRMYATVSPSSHQWELRMTGSSPEADWMPYSSETAETTSMILTDEAVKQDIAFNHGAFLDEFLRTPYVRQNHNVRVRGHLQQFETYDEKVTFHNVQIEASYGADLLYTVFRSQSVVTPSGLHVTLPVQGKGTRTQNSIQEAPGLTVNVQPDTGTQELPKSPLEQRYKKPITISLQPVKPFGLISQSTGATTTHQITLIVSKGDLILPAKSADLSLIVRQRVDLQSIPVTLTAPITDAMASQKL